MTNAPAEPQGSAAPGAAPGEAPFGPSFFASVLRDRVLASCEQNPGAVPVVELELADGVTLDLCHVPIVESQWLGAAVYRDRETCREMDLTFVPYGLITRVTISMWHRSQRPIGFDPSAEHHYMGPAVALPGTDPLPAAPPRDDRA